MATLIAKADAGWLASTTWGVAEAGTGAVMTTTTALSYTGATYAWSSAFTCTNADVLQGVLLHVKRVNTGGTFTVGLSADNGTSAAVEVTVNVSDVPADKCWMFFSFGASPVTADGGNDYKVGVKSSGSETIAVYRDGTANNWARVIRTAAEAAPTTGDNLFIAKEWTSAATGTARVVTMDAIAASIVDHGTLDIGQGGTLTYGAEASTAYYLRLSGDLNVWSGGTLNIGTVATPIPSTSTAKLNLDCGSNVQFGLIVNNGGTFVAQGASKTTWTYLASDEAVNSTELTTADATGWADNDEIAIASTTRTAAQCEKGTLNGAANGTTITVDGFGGVGGGLAYAHSGTAPTRAEIINLTRNVQVFGASVSYHTYIYIAASAAANLDYAEVYWIGSNDDNKFGVDIVTVTGSADIRYCSIHSFPNIGRGIQITGASVNNIELHNNVLFNGNFGLFSLNNPTSGTVNFTGNIGILAAAASLFTFNDMGGAITNNRAIGSAGNGFYLNEAVTVPAFSGNEAHACVASGVNVVVAIPIVIQSCKSWRNGAPGIRFTRTIFGSVEIRDSEFFGNTPANVDWDTGTGYHLVSLYVSNSLFHGDSSFATASGINLNGLAFFPMVALDACTFGSPSGVKVPHATADIIIGSGSYVGMTGNNTVLGSTTTISGIATAAPKSFFKFQKYGQTAGDHRAIYQHGTISTDSTTGMFRTAAPSARLTPTSASVKLESAPIMAAVLSGATKTFSVYVRKSVVGDGAAYNGAQPRLVLKANPAAGIAADVVLDTATVASDGDWEQLTGTSAAVTDNAVLEAVVDCDGTAGWINIDE